MERTSIWKKLEKKKTKRKFWGLFGKKKQVKKASFTINQEQIEFNKAKRELLEKRKEMEWRQKYCLRRNNNLTYEELKHMRMSRMSEEARSAMSERTQKLVMPIAEMLSHAPVLVNNPKLDVLGEDQIRKYLNEFPHEMVKLILNPYPPKEPLDIAAVGISLEINQRDTLRGTYKQPAYISKYRFDSPDLNEAPEELLMVALYGENKWSDTLLKQSTKDYKISYLRAQLIDFFEEEYKIPPMPSEEDVRRHMAKSRRLTTARSPITHKLK